MVLKGADIMALVNPAAFLIIFAGTAASLLNAFPLEQMKKFPVLLKKLFKQTRVDVQDRIAALHW